MVLKPAEDTPGAALALAGILAEAGLPEGALSVVCGDPVMISERLLDSPIIRGVTFTGSTAIGKRLAARAAATMKVMLAELGGHSPVLIFEDADIEAVAVAAVRAKYRNSGQVCISPTRFYIHESVHDRFVNRFTEAAARLRLGDGRDPATTMGPVVNARRIAALDRFVLDAHNRGIEVRQSGGLPEKRGFFFRPTILVDGREDCLAANEEPFGPLALTRSFGSLEEAVALANRPPFGLAAYAFTHDSRRIIRLGEDIESGNVIFNHWQASLPETPFGGVKDSGIGREGGMEGLAAFQTVKYLSEA